MKGTKLTVEIANTDGIVVHQREIARTRPGQGLRYIAANAADAKHGHMGLF